MANPENLSVPFAQSTVKLWPKPELVPLRPFDAHRKDPRTRPSDYS
jgi:hypothetical protein